MCWVHKGQVTFSQSVILLYYLSLHFKLLSWLRKTPEAIGHCTETIQNLPLIRVRFCQFHGLLPRRARLVFLKAEYNSNSFLLQPESRFTDCSTPESSGFFFVWDTRFSVQQVCCKQLGKHGRWKVQKKTLCRLWSKLWHVTRAIMEKPRKEYPPF